MCVLNIICNLTLSNDNVFCTFTFWHFRMAKRKYRTTFEHFRVTTSKSDNMFYELRVKMVKSEWFFINFYFAEAFCKWQSHFAKNKCHFTNSFYSLPNFFVSTIFDFCSLPFWRVSMWFEFCSLSKMRRDFGMRFRLLNLSTKHTKHMEVLIDLIQKLFLCIALSKMKKW